MSEVEEVGIFTPTRQSVPELSVGEVGFVWANIKDLHTTRIGDTITEVARPTAEAFPGFAEAKPMVFAGLFPTDADDYANLRDAMEKLRLNDASFTFLPESSTALGFGFRCGFLGLLHMEIVQERLEREFDLDLITTAPGVNYRVTMTDGEVLDLVNPNHLPPESRVERMEEPYIAATIITRDDFLGGLLKLCEDRRGVQKSMEYLSANRVVLSYEFPLNEVVLDFYDKLKSVSKGYASFDYEFAGYREGDLVKLDILVNGEAGGCPVDHRSPGRIDGQRKVAGDEDEGDHPAPDVRSCDPGGNRREDHRARDGPRDAQERDRQVLRRRHHPQAQAPGEAERGKEAHEEGRARRHPAGCVSRRAEGRMSGRTRDEASGKVVRHSSAREWYESLLVAGIFVLFVRTFVVQTYQVPTGSMEKTILVGDHLLVNKFAYAPRLEGWARLLPYRDVHRGDIIVFKKPGDDVNPGNVLVKRAVAGPGDTIVVRDKAPLGQRRGRGRTARSAQRSGGLPERSGDPGHGAPARPVRPVRRAARLLVRHG